MTKRMWIVLIACGLVFGGIFGFKWFVSVKITEFLDNMQMPVPTVTTTQASQDSWVATLSAVGSVKAVNGIALTSQVPGLVELINFESGDKVKKGDLLVRLDDQEDKAALKSLEAAVKLAKQNLERYEPLYRQGSLSKSQMDQANSQYDQAVAQVAAQKARVQYKNIVAPFDGELGIRQVDLGQYVSPGSSLVMLQSLSPIYVNFSLPEQDLPLIKKGLKVQAKLDSQPGKVYEGEVFAMDPGVDAATRNFNVQAVFANEDEDMHPGMFASILINMSEASDVVVIPRTAIKYNPYGDAVFVVQRDTSDDGEEKLTVVSRFVELGQARGDMVSVVKGLEAGEEIATSGLLKLRNNIEILVDNTIQPPTELDPQLNNS